MWDGGGGDRHRFQTRRPRDWHQDGTIVGGGLAPLLLSTHIFSVRDMCARLTLQAGRILVVAPLEGPWVGWGNLATITGLLSVVIGLIPSQPH